LQLGLLDLGLLRENVYYELGFRPVRTRIRPAHRDVPANPGRYGAKWPTPNFFEMAMPNYN
jgi:hypothetical protein